MSDELPAEFPVLSRWTELNYHFTTETRGKHSAKEKCFLRHGEPLGKRVKSFGFFRVFRVFRGGHKK